jgi:hypothetical protein
MRGFAHVSAFDPLSARGGNAEKCLPFARTWQKSARSGKPKQALCAIKRIRNYYPKILVAAAYTSSQIAGVQL